MAARFALTLTLSRRAGEGIGVVGGGSCCDGVSGIPRSLRSRPLTLREGGGNDGVLCFSLGSPPASAGMTWGCGNDEGFAGMTGVR